MSRVMETQIAAALKARDRREKDRWGPLIQRHARVCTQLERMKARNAELESALASSSSNLDGSASSVSLSSSSPSLLSSARVAELNAELTERYKELLDTKEALGRSGERVAELEARVAGLEVDKGELEARVGELQAKYEEEKTMSLALGDEMQILQMELLDVDQKRKELEDENSKLVDRWLQKCAADAEKLNEANAFYENMRAAKEALDLSASASAAFPDGPDLSGPGSHLDAMSSSPSGAGPSSGFALLPSRAKKSSLLHGSEGHSVAYSHSGDRLVSGGGDKALFVYQAGSLDRVATLRGFSGSVTSVMFSANDEYVLGASADESIRVFDTGTERTVHTLTGHSGKIYSALFSSDTSRVLSAAHDRTIKIWDLHRGLCSKTNPVRSSPNDIALSNDDNLIVSGHHNGSVIFWDARSGDPVASVKDLSSKQITSVEYSPDGDAILINSRDNSLLLLDARTHIVRATYSADGFSAGLNTARATFSPDGRYVTAGSTTGDVYVWSTDGSGGLQAVLAGGHSTPVASVSWRPTGQSLASISKDGTVVVWE